MYSGIRSIPLPEGTARPASEHRRQKTHPQPEPLGARELSEGLSELTSLFWMAESVPSLDTNLMLLHTILGTFNLWGF